MKAVEAFGPIDLFSSNYPIASTLKLLLLGYQTCMQNIYDPI